jgi:pyochelin biosynthetic protein PchC
MTTVYRHGSWCRRYHKSPDARTRLVVFPHAGGSSSFYVRFSQALSTACEVLVVQYPGRQDRRSEPMIEDLAMLAVPLADALAPLADRPLALFGHSMGATVAYEVARRLAVDMVFVSARPAPGRVRDRGVHRKPNPELIEELRAMHGTATGLFDDRELMELVLPVIRSDYRASETYRYRPGPPIDSPIVALAGTTDPCVTPAEMSHWSAYTRAAFGLHEFDGGHFYLESQRAAVADLITGRLATVSRPQDGAQLARGDVRQSLL